MQDLANGHRRRRIRILINPAIGGERALDEESRAHLAEHVGTVRRLVVDAEARLNPEIERFLESSNAGGRSAPESVLRIGARAHVDVAPRLADQTPCRIGQSAGMIEGEIRSQQVLVRERLDLFRGNTVRMDFQSQAARERPVLPVWIRERAQRHQLVVRREVLLLQAGEVRGPLVVPRPELRRS